MKRTAHHQKQRRKSTQQGKKKSYFLFSFKGERNFKRAADWEDIHNHPCQA